MRAALGSNFCALRLSSHSMTNPRERIWPFFVLTFAVTWGLQVPAVLAQRGWLPGDPQLYLPLAGLGLLGPLLAATILTARSGGRAAVRELYAPLRRWRVPVGWYLVALVVPVTLLSALLLLLNQAGRQGPVAYLPSLGGLCFGIVISVVEEVGWRGYALSRLEARWGRLATAGTLGALWYVWHLPMFVGQGVPMDLVLVLLLHFVGASLFFSWIWSGTRGSLLLVALAHLAAHLNNSHRALPADALPLIVHAIIYAGLGLYVTRSDYMGAARRAARQL